MSTPPFREGLPSSVNPGVFAKTSRPDTHRTGSDEYEVSPATSHEEDDRGASLVVNHHQVRNDTVDNHDEALNSRTGVPGTSSLSTPSAAVATRKSPRALGGQRRPEPWRKPKVGSNVPIAEHHLQQHAGGGGGGMLGHSDTFVGSSLKSFEYMSSDDEGPRLSRKPKPMGARGGGAGGGMPPPQFSLDTEDLDSVVESTTSRNGKKRRPGGATTGQKPLKAPQLPESLPPLKSEVAEEDVEVEDKGASSTTSLTRSITNLSFPLIASQYTFILLPLQALFFASYFSSDFFTAKELNSGGSVSILLASIQIGGALYMLFAFVFLAGLSNAADVLVSANNAAIAERMEAALEKLSQGLGGIGTGSLTSSPAKQRPFLGSGASPSMDSLTQVFGSTPVTFGDSFGGGTTTGGGPNASGLPLPSGLIEAVVKEALEEAEIKIRRSTYKILISSLISCYTVAAIIATLWLTIGPILVDGVFNPKLRAGVYTGICFAPLLLSVHAALPSFTKFFQFQSAIKQATEIGLSNLENDRAQDAERRNRGGGAPPSSATDRPASPLLRRNYQNQQQSTRGSFSSSTRVSILGDGSQWMAAASKDQHINFGSKLILKVFAILQSTFGIVAWNHPIAISAGFSVLLSPIFFCFNLFMAGRHHFIIDPVDLVHFVTGYHAHGQEEQSIVRMVTGLLCAQAGAGLTELLMLLFFLRHSPGIDGHNDREEEKEKNTALPSRVSSVLNSRGLSPQRRNGAAASRGSYGAMDSTPVLAGGGRSIGIEPPPGFIPAVSTPIDQQAPTFVSATTENSPLLRRNLSSKPVDPSSPHCTRQTLTSGHHAGLLKSSWETWSIRGNLIPYLKVASWTLIGFLVEAWLVETYMLLAPLMHCDPVLGGGFAVAMQMSQMFFPLVVGLANSGATILATVPPGRRRQRHLVRIVSLLAKLWLALVALVTSMIILVGPSFVQYMLGGAAFTLKPGTIQDPPAEIAVHHKDIPFGGGTPHSKAAATLSLKHNESSNPAVTVSQAASTHHTHGSLASSYGVSCLHLVALFYLADSAHYMFQCTFRGLRWIRSLVVVNAIAQWMLGLPSSVLFLTAACPTAAAIQEGGVDDDNRGYPILDWIASCLPSIYRSHIFGLRNALFQWNVKSHRIAMNEENFVGGPDVALLGYIWPLLLFELPFFALLLFYRLVWKPNRLREKRRKARWAEIMKRHREMERKDRKRHTRVGASSKMRAGRSEDDSEEDDDSADSLLSVDLSPPADLLREMGEDGVGSSIATGIDDDGEDNSSIVLPPPTTPGGTRSHNPPGTGLAFSGPGGSVWGVIPVESLVDTTLEMNQDESAISALSAGDMAEEGGGQQSGGIGRSIDEIVAALRSSVTTTPLTPAIGRGSALRGEHWGNEDETQALRHPSAGRRAPRAGNTGKSNKRGLKTVSSSSDVET